MGGARRARPRPGSGTSTAPARLRDEHGPGRTAFTARVVVTQVPGQPVEVIAAWTLESAEPVDLGRYSFEA